ncbi:MAG: endonuclease/exonuclease/phosphatase family protein [Immundisolibacterales bacterium]|nr:endonuclease/exonuclease/phosphatase family protein [Immundisolibacterales bacterium]
MISVLIEETQAESPTLSPARRAAHGTGAATHDGAAEGLDVLRRIEVVPPPEPSSTPAHELRVAFWNAERAKYLEASADLLRIVAADVVLLCEMDLGMARSGQHHTTRWLAEALDLGHVFGVEFVELGLGDARERSWHAGAENREGLHGGAILAAREFDRPALIRIDAGGAWFDGLRDEPRIGGRIAVAGKLDVAGVSVAFVSTHLESHSDPDDRARQATALLDAIDVYHGDGPVILGGDFNTTSASYSALNVHPGRKVLERADPGRFLDPVPYEPLFEVLQARGYDRAACNTAHATQRTRPDGTPEPPHGRIDWFFTRRLLARDPATVAAVDDAGAAISDHELLAVTIAPA